MASKSKLEDWNCWVSREQSVCGPCSTEGVSMSTKSGKIYFSELVFRYSTLTLSALFLTFFLFVPCMFHIVHLNPIHFPVPLRQSSALASPQIG